MSIAEPAVERFPHPIVAYIAATRPPFILATVVPVILGLSYSVYQGHDLNMLNAILTLVAAVLLHAGINVLNDYYDALNGTDDNNDERIFPFTGGSRFIQNEVMTRQQTLLYGICLMLAVMLIGVHLIRQTGMPLFWLGMLGMVIGWGYSAPPLRLNSRGIGELCVLAGFSLLPLGAWLVQTNSFSVAVVMVALPVGLLTANLLFINQFPDRKADIQAGKLHWVARLEPRVARWGYVVIAGLAWMISLMLVVFGLLPVAALIALLPAILTYKASRILIKHADHPQQLTPAIQLTILAMLAHGVLLSVILAVHTHLVA
jgi:1,4-dihydroxy-2-naphthoate octaprenyltransferase